MSKRNSKKNPKVSLQTPKVREEVSPGHLKRIIAVSEARTREIEESRVVYPDPDLFDSLDLSGVKALGFTDKVEWDPADLDILFARRRSRKSRGKQQGGQRGGSQSQGGKKGLPDPKIVAAKVYDIIKNFKVVGNDGNVVMGTWNMEFLDASKAKYFLETYKHIVPRFHIIGCTEITLDGLQVIANALGYKAYASVENTRSQAVGFLVHPRLKVKGNPISYDEIANVQGIPNLRPAYRLDVEDTATGDEYAAVVVHMKSMRGGPASTAPVRRQQAKKLVEVLGEDFVGFICGDWNSHLDNPSVTDNDPLKQAGFKLVGPKDKTPTHIMKSRLDGFFVMNFGKVGRLQVFNFWRELGRDLSDHGTVRCQKRVCGGVGNDSTCGTVDDPSGPYSDSPSDPVEVDTSTE